MKLSRKVDFLQLAIAFGIGTLALVVTSDPKARFVLVVLGLVLAIVSKARLGALVAKRAFSHLQRSIEAENYPAARTTIGDLRELYSYSPPTIELLHLTEGHVLAGEGKHAEAIHLYESIARDRLGAIYLPLLLNNLAWSLAEIGDGRRAVDVSRQSLEASEEITGAATNEDLRAAQLGTRGAALVVAGEAKEGVELLEQSLARGGNAFSQAARAFYLGEGHLALGDRAAAEEAWRRAEDASPRSASGRRAAARLSDSSS